MPAVLCKLCRTCGVERTDKTLDCGVSPLVRGALSLLISPLVVGSSACGDMKSCDGFGGSEGWGMEAAAVREERYYINVEVVSGQQFRFAPNVPVYMRAALEAMMSVLVR